MENPPAPEFHSMEDFPLEESRDDTLRSAFDQVIHIDANIFGIIELQVKKIIYI